MVLGMCWYRADQYERLLEKSVDRDSMPGTHAEWLASATRGLMELRASGHRVDPVEVDVEAILRWCRLIGRPFDGAARAEYVADLLQARHTGGGR